MDDCDAFIQNHTSSSHHIDNLIHNVGKVMEFLGSIKQVSLPSMCQRRFLLAKKGKVAC